MQLTRIAIGFCIMSSQKLSERVKAIRTSMGLTQSELSKRIGVSQRQVANYESGLSEPRDIVLTKLSSTLGVSKEYLLHGTEEYGANGRLPLMSEIELVHFGQFYVSPSQYAEIILPNHPSAFAYRHYGDSLEPYYEEGEILIIEPNKIFTRFSTGKKSLYLVLFNGTARVRHIEINDDTMILWTPNRNYPPIVLDKKLSQHVAIIGRVIGSIQ